MKTVALQGHGCDTASSLLLNESAGHLGLRACRPGASSRTRYYRKVPMQTGFLREPHSLIWTNISEIGIHDECGILHVTSLDLTEIINDRRAALIAHVPNPMENRKQRPIFFSILACKPRMIGIGMVNIHISNIKFMILVEYVKANLSTQVAVAAAVVFHQPWTGWHPSPSMISITMSHMTTQMAVAITKMRNLAAAKMR